VKKAVSQCTSGVGLVRGELSLAAADGSKMAVGWNPLMVSLICICRLLLRRLLVVMAAESLMEPPNTLHCICCISLETPTDSLFGRHTAGCC
jgi:hypothetical protein